MAIVLDITKFRESFPVFADPVAFPDALIQRHWDSATCYISDEDYGWLSGSCRESALSLMAAHLLALEQIIIDGGQAGFVQSATVDKVSVSLTPPPQRNNFSWWLSHTPYGQQLLALLKAKSAGGFYVGGSYERAAFRKVGGAF